MEDAMREIQSRVEEALTAVKTEPALKANGEPRVKDGPGAPKMSERGKITGHNLKVGMKLRNKQMAYLMEEMQDPDFQQLGSVVSLGTSFDIEPEEDGLNTAGITWRLLNTQGFGRGDHTASPSYMSVAVFMNSIQTYFPPSLRVAKKREHYKLWKRESFTGTNTFSDETIELLDAMVDWLQMMKQKIEDKLASIYWFNGKSQHLEILKRRYKDDWSEKIEQSIDASVADKKIEVTFEDL